MFADIYIYVPYLPIFIHKYLWDIATDFSIGCVHRKNLFLLRVMILQTAIIQPIVQFISAVLWADNKFDKSGVRCDHQRPSFYLSFSSCMWPTDSFCRHSRLTEEKCVEMTEISDNVMFAVINVLSSNSASFASHFRSISGNRLSTWPLPKWCPPS